MEINFNTLRHSCKYQSFSSKYHKDCDFNKPIVEEFYCEHNKNILKKCIRKLCPLNSNKDELEKDLCRLCGNNDSKPLFCNDCKEYKR